jgi:hypothetical protein
MRRTALERITTDFVPGEIISYMQMCGTEQAQLQRGMNYRMPTGRSVVLMSRRPNAPYADEVLDDGRTIIYEGHDMPRSAATPIPKLVDQPAVFPSGTRTQNGTFLKATQDFKAGQRTPEPILIYEKLKKGIWVFNGVFDLLDGWQVEQENRKVFKFRFEVSTQKVIHTQLPAETIDELEHPRVIPGIVKQVVFKRDGGKCVMCGAADELHFDHVLPYSRGGTSLSADNVQLLCARHNLQKGAKIQ